ncbi:MAG: uracil-DNA glycosylase, partial [Acholeplasmatales bacterium]
MAVTWKDVLHDTWSSPTFARLLESARKRARKTTVYPPEEAWFYALTATPFAEVKVVILGQDPYHGKGQAMGLSFSVDKQVPVPPSLMNIFKELEADLKIPIPAHGDLRGWAEEGVLLLNTTLTVEANRPLSHADLGWGWFTDAIMRALNAKTPPVVFMLWGKHAQSKTVLITHPKHLVLKAP